MYKCTCISLLKLRNIVGGMFLSVNIFLPSDKVPNAFGFSLSLLRLIGDSPGSC